MSHFLFGGHCNRGGTSQQLNSLWCTSSTIEVCSQWSTSSIGTQLVRLPLLSLLQPEQTTASLLSSAREASAERSQAYHSEREGVMSSSSQGLNFIGTGEPVALFSHQRRLSQDAFSERESNLLMFSGVMNRFSEILTPRMLRFLAYSSKIRIDKAGANSGISSQLY